MRLGPGLERPRRLTHARAMPDPAVLERDGCPLHYWVHGPAGAPWVVLLHGAGMDHQMFDPQVEALAADHRVLVWDCRGHGQSRPLHATVHIEDLVGDLLAILDEVGAARAVIGGHSLGGYVAQHFYRQHPSRARALVVIGATGIALPNSRMALLGLRIARPVMRALPYRWLVGASAKGTALRPAVRDYARAAMLQIDARDFFRIWTSVEEAITREGMPEHRVRVPMLVMHGARDRMGTIRRDAPRWRAHDPSMTFIEIPEAGHNANQDNPEFVNRVLRQFLQALPG